MSETKTALVLNPQRIGLAESMRQDWVVNAEEGTTVDQILQPSYWAHVAANMSVNDRIEVRLETGEWILELLITSLGRNWAAVYVCQRYDLATANESAPPAAKHIVKWRGPQHKHCVVRVSDNEVIQEGHNTAEDARAAMVQYERTVSLI